MNKRLGRLLRPSMTFYFVLLAGFVVAAALLDQYLLAAAEALGHAIGAMRYGTN